MKSSAVRAAVLVAAVVVPLVAGCGGTTDGAAVGASTSAGSGASTSATGTAPGSGTEPPGTAASTAESGTPAASPGGQTGANDVLGPFGWGPVTIGLGADAAGATGVFIDTPPPDVACEEWQAVFASPLESAIASPTIGVAAIIVRADAVIRTPEGVRIGSTADEVHAAYPEFEVSEVDTPNGVVIVAPGNPEAAYRMNFDDAGKVSYLTLESVNQDCYG